VDKKFFILIDVNCPKILKYFYNCKVVDVKGVDRPKKRFRNKRLELSLYLVYDERSATLPGCPN
jgi:hypothetical protein